MKSMSSVRIQGAVQCYPWGLPAATSLVGQLARVTNPEQPCAELWFGAHPKGPSVIESDRQTTLRDLIAKDPAAMLGKALADKYQSLPFLFKVLSVGKALSIQAHPSKDLAIKLHAGDPLNYPDENHKPEVGVALSRVRLLYGLRPLADARETLSRVPELTPIIGPQAVRVIASEQDEQKFYRMVLKNLYALEPLQVQRCCGSISQRLKQKRLTHPEEILFAELAAQFPLADVGLLVALFLNLVELRPGEGIFIGPHLPHAYLSGELIECMASSDNVVRAGLTEKHQDVAALLEMLSFRSESPKKLHPQLGEDGIAWYVTPAAEFKLGVIHERATIAGGKPTLLVQIAGNGVIKAAMDTFELSAGQGIFMPPSQHASTAELTAGALAIATVP